MGVSFTVEMTVMIMFHGNMYSTRTHTHTLVYTRITNVKWHTLLQLQNKKTSISCYVQPPWRMLSRFTSTSTAQCWWQQPLPHSCFLSAGCEGGRKKTQEHIPVSLFFLSPHCNIHLLTAAGARESLSSCVSEHGCASKFPALFPASSLSVEMLSLQTAHSFHHFVVTWSGPLPNKGDHLL